MKYKILWIDDQWEAMDSFKEVCELPENGMEVVPCKYAVEGMRLFEEHLEEWSGAILDAKVLYNEEAKMDTQKGLVYSIKRINELSSKRKVPYYIFTGQPDLASDTEFAEAHEGYYYEKDRDEDRLIADIKRNAEEQEDNQIINKHATVFDTWPQLRHDLLRILKADENEDWQNNSLFNDIRKIVSNIIQFLCDKGYCDAQFKETNLAECSKNISEKDYVPIYIKRNIHSLVAITNEGSHWGVANSMVAEGKAPYLLRSLIYEMLNVLYWCKDVVNKEPTHYEQVDSMS